MSNFQASWPVVVAPVSGYTPVCAGSARNMAGGPLVFGAVPASWVAGAHAVIAKASKIRSEVRHAPSTRT